MTFSRGCSVALISSCLVLSLASGPAHAGPIFNVNRTIGLGSVVGSIETDGTIGVLATGNILDWTLTLNDGTGPFTLLGPLSGSNSALAISGTSFSESASQLLFDFSNNSGAWVLFQNRSIGSSGETVATTLGSDVFASRSGVLAVADSELAPVPEPATLLLLSTTMAGISLVQRQRQRQTQRRH
jgi:PEP-CTERM motif